MRPNDHLARIAADVASEARLTAAEIYKRTRDWRISHPRQEAMLRQKEAGFSYPVIGAFWGYDHTTVIYACEAAAMRRELSREPLIIFRTRRIAA